MAEFLRVMEPGLTQAKLAAKVGISESRLNWIESGGSTPLDSEATKLAKVLRIDDKDALQLPPTRDNINRVVLGKL